MRCFIGIPVLGELAKQCVSLAEMYPLASSEANLHMTLAFLGNTGVARLPALQDGLAALTRDRLPFSVTVECCEPFPGEDGPWLALTAALTAPLQALHHDVAELAGRHGFELERRPFRPHITLAKPGQSVPVIRGEWRLPVDAVWLYESQQAGNSRPIYQSLARFPFSGP